MVSLKGVFWTRTIACMHHELALALALFWMLRSQGASLGAPQRASECNARQTLEKCETFPPIFKLSSRQIIPLQCESWFVVQIPVHHVLVRPQDLFCTPRFPSWHRFQFSMCPSEKGRRRHLGENRVQTSGASRASASPKRAIKTSRVDSWRLP